MVSGTVYPDHTAMPISRSDVKENDVVRVASRRPSKGKIPRKALTLADVHSSIKSIDHAIRGPIMARSFELQAELRNVRTSHSVAVKIKLPKKSIFGTWLLYLACFSMLIKFIWGLLYFFFFSCTARYVDLWKNHRNPHNFYPLFKGI